MTASLQVEATVATPEFVTVPLQQQEQEQQPRSPLRSCLAGSFCSTTTPSSRALLSRRVRLAESAPVVHEPPQVALSSSSTSTSSLLQDNSSTTSLWYTGAEIRRIKQAAVPVLSRLDHNQSVPAAIEVNWQTGTTSTRGLEFGSKAGQQRKRAALQFQRLVLQEQARLRHDYRHNPQEAAQQLAACAAAAALPAVDLALQIAVDDAAFVCNYIENVVVPRLVAAPTPPVVLIVARRLWKAARQGVRQRRQRQNVPQKWDHQRARCDTESTTTIMAACS